MMISLELVFSFSDNQGSTQQINGKALEKELPIHGVYATSFVDGT